MTETQVYVHGGADQFRRASWGVLYRHGTWTHLRGGVKTNTNAARAQVLAVLIAVRHAPAGPLVVYSPNKYVAKNVGRLFQWRAAGRLDSRNPAAVKNADLWAQLERLIRQRPDTVRAELIAHGADLDHQRAKGLARHYRKLSP